MNIRNFERVAIDTVAAVSPWLTPAIPAYLVAGHAAKYLVQGNSWIDQVFVVVCALAVETVGLSAVHTAIGFYTWNTEKRQNDDAAPFWLAMFAGVFYVVLVVLVNAVLDATQAPWALIAAKAMLSLLSVDAALVIALRAQHARRLNETERLRAEKKAERQARKAETGANPPEPTVTPVEIVSAPAEKPEKAAWVKDHMATTGVSRATAYRAYDKMFETEVKHAA